MKQLTFMSLLLLALSACSQEATPYTESNETLSSPQERGYIQTH